METNRLSITHFTYLLQLWVYCENNLCSWRSPIYISTQSILPHTHKYNIMNNKSLKFSQKYTRFPCVSKWPSSRFKRWKMKVLYFGSFYNITKATMINRLRQQVTHSTSQHDNKTHSMHDFIAFLLCTADTGLPHVQSVWYSWTELSGRLISSMVLRLVGK